MSLSTFVKRLQNIMRSDPGINGDAQRIEQIVWLLFLKIYDAREQEWAFVDKGYTSIIPAACRWQAWAHDEKDGKALTGDELLDFVNNTLFPTLRNLPVDESTPVRQILVRDAFVDNSNYMKNGVLLRQVVNVIDELEVGNYSERHAFGEIYETILKSLQSAGNAGEFYTPRAVTDFMAQRLAPKLGESIADFACGTGGFLTSALKLLEPQIKDVKDGSKLYRASVHGVEKKALPFLLCVTNLFLHDMDAPQVLHGNALERNVRDYEQKDKFDIVLMNPPYGGSELDSIKSSFPAEFRSSETADLFVALIMYRLKKNGRAAVIVSDGFLFGADNATTAIKKRLLEQFNLHTIVRLPATVFAPYTDITTNILFFENTHPTEQVWVYRQDMPQGIKRFNKTKPMRLTHFDPLCQWWEKREPLGEEDTPKAACYTVEEIAANGYNLDLCGFPHEVEKVLPPRELMHLYHQQRASLNASMDRLLAQIEALLPKDGE